MGDSYDLHVRRHLMEDRTHLHGYIARHARVDLVEDDGGKQRRLRYERLDSQHQARELATRRHLANLTRFRPFVSAEEEGHLVATQRTELFGRRDFHLEPSILHSECSEGRKNLLLDERSRLAAQRCELLSLTLEERVGAVDLFHSLLYLVVHRVSSLYCLVKAVFYQQERVDRVDIMFFLQTVDGVEPVGEVFLPFGRESEVAVDGLDG